MQNNLNFYKYQATGNDFIILDNRQSQYKLNNLQVANLCDRHFGIGADGLIELCLLPNYDFEMVYYNSDGNKSSMCGNGGRCIVQFAKALNILKDNKAFFLAPDGDHHAYIKDELIYLQMTNPKGFIQKNETDYWINTGSPHYVRLYNDNLEQLDIITEARAIRYNNEYKQDGTNVNFIIKTENGITVRTYERGVEDETLSCGTGVTAAALVANHVWKELNDTIKVNTKGGELAVKFNKDWTDVWLIGEAKKVFIGEINI